MRALVVLLALALASPASALEFDIATPDEGAAIVRADDEFTAALSPADLSIRLREREGGSVDALQALYAGEVLAWTPAERARLEAMLTRVGAPTQRLASLLPETVYLIKNSDRLDGGLAHTRGAGIFFGDALPESDERLDWLFYHELFHVLSRRQTARHDELYGLIGFQRCTSVAMPEAVRASLVTNPDAPVVNYVAPAAAGEAYGYLTPMLMAATPRWDPAQPQFTSYFDLRFYAFNRDSAGACAMVAGEGGDGLRIEGARAAPMIFAHAGANTNYLFHPEELLADNFAQLMTGRADAPNPEVHQRLAAWLGISGAR